MRHTKGHTANRRSHHALEALPLTKCAKCGAMSWRHRACLSCGTYRGRAVMNTLAKLEKRQKQKAKSTKTKTS